MTAQIDDASLFGIDNLPYGVISAEGGSRRVSVRYRDLAVDVAHLLGDDRFAVPTLNKFLAEGAEAWRWTRNEIQRRLAQGVPEGASTPLSLVETHLPFEVRDYVDFYASQHHAANLGRIFRPDAVSPLTPNWKHLPISYHGRASSVVVSGTDVVRPSGQYRIESGDRIVFGESRRLDFEAELGFVVGNSSALGSPIPIRSAAEHLFGVVLFNDWSARDIQAWEYVPLGPHLGKSFASTMSAWVTPMLALAEARIPLPEQNPAPLPHLSSGDLWGLDIEIDVSLNGNVISRPKYRDIYWSPTQMLSHMTSNGAPTRPGDLFASGTISGESAESFGCLAELTAGGERPLSVGGGTRLFLEDGDSLVLSASAPGAEGGRIGLGSCAGRILSAPSS